MTPAQLALARRLVAAPWWEWPPVLAVDPEWAMPDLTDYATAGVLLGILPPNVVICDDGGESHGGWHVEVVGRCQVYGACLGEALALALLEVRGG